jgi:hypothetical protein
MTSGTAVALPDRSSVLTPTRGIAASTALQMKLNATLIGVKGALDVKAMTKLWDPLPPAIVTGVLGEPVRAFVDGFVV